MKYGFNSLFALSTLPPYVGLLILGSPMQI